MNKYNIIRYGTIDGSPRLDITQAETWAGAHLKLQESYESDLRWLMKQNIRVDNVGIELKDNGQAYTEEELDNFDTYNELSYVKMDSETSYQFKYIKESAEFDYVLAVCIKPISQ